MRLSLLLALLVAGLPVRTEARGAEAPSRKEASLRGLLLRSSLRLSRTHERGENLLLPRWEVPGWDIRYTTEQNYRRAVDFVLANAHELPLDLETATRLNRLLTEGLVPERILGQASFRADASRFYRWLASPRAEALGRRDPVALAERVHAGLGYFDAFPDGNGRTARLMADLVLLKHGRAPALFTTLEEYFERGIFSRDMADKGLRRRSQIAYYREAARRGQVELERLLAD